MAIKQDEILAEQEQEVLRLTLPGPEGTIPSPDVGNVSTATTGVPFGRLPGEPETARQLEAVKRSSQQALLTLDPDVDKAAHAKATAAFNASKATLDSLRNTSAPQEDLQQKPIFADGNSSGFIALHDSAGNVKDVLFANGPGGTRVPTLKDVMKMMTEPVNSAAAKELNSIAADSVVRYGKEIDRYGANQDFKNFVGEQIQHGRQENLLQGQNVSDEQKVLSTVRDNKVATSTTLKILFPEMKPEDLKQVSTRTVDEQEENRQLESMGETAKQTYDRLKVSPNIQESSSIRGAVIGGLLENHRDQLVAMGPNSAKRTIENILSGVDALRISNFQEQANMISMQSAEERTNFENVGLNKIVQTALSQDPVALVQDLYDAESKVIDMDRIDQIGQIHASRIAAQNFDAVRKATKKEFGDGNTVRNTFENDQKKFVGRALIGKMVQQVKFLDDNQKHIGGEVTQQMMRSLEEGTLDDDFPRFADVVSKVQRKFSNGVDKARIEQQSFELQEQKAQLKKRNKALDHLARGHALVTTGRGTAQWTAPHNRLSTDDMWENMTRDGKAMAFLSEQLGGDSDAAFKIISEASNKRKVEDAKKAITEMRRERSSLFSNIQVTGNVPSTQPKPDPAGAVKQKQVEDAVNSALDLKDALDKGSFQGDNLEKKQRELQAKLDVLLVSGQVAKQDLVSLGLMNAE